MWYFIAANYNSFRKVIRSRLGDLPALTTPKTFSGTIGAMHSPITTKEKIFAFLGGIVVGLVVLAIALYQIPSIQDRVSWRIDRAVTYMRGVIDPVRAMPTPDVNASAATGATGDTGAGAMPLPQEKTLAPTASPTLSPTQPATALPRQTLPPPPPSPTPTAIPGSIELAAPAYEKQSLNNCGPATLTMHLRYYGWDGNQSKISDLIKPKREDRNVNVEELVSYVNTEVPGLEIQYRVGGDIQMLKKLLAAGFPVTIEETFIMAESYWANDDRWAGHYLLLTGYDDVAQQFISQDVFVGPNFKVPYSVLEKNWKAFNHVYILIYPPDQRETVQSVLAEEWDANANRQHAMEKAQQEAEKDSTDSYAWFNLGTNLVYFEKYSQAANAYDEARKDGLPQRMLRYQFGPFFAYFHTGRMEDLMAILDYALKRTPTSEEAMLWMGWAVYRQGDKEAAANWFGKALEAHPNYSDAMYALDFLRNN
jgi:tetratricopeptide (TPR) repeat protein